MCRQYPGKTDTIFLGIICEQARARKAKCGKLLMKGLREMSDRNFEFNS